MHANQPEKLVASTDRNRAPSAGDMLKSDEFKDDLEKSEHMEELGERFSAGKRCHPESGQPQQGIARNFKGPVSRLSGDRFQSTLLRKTRIFFVRTMVVML